MPMTVDGAIEAMMGTVSRIMTGRLRQRALMAEWPRSAVEDLRVVDDHGLLVAAPLDDEASALEYGTQSKSPHPAVGNFFADHTVYRQVQDEAQKAMGPLLDIVGEWFR